MEILAQQSLTPMDGYKRTSGPTHTGHGHAGSSQLENKGQLLHWAFLRSCLPFTFKSSLFIKWGLFLSQGQHVFYKNAFSIRFSLSLPLAQTYVKILAFLCISNLCLSLLPFKVRSYCFYVYFVFFKANPTQAVNLGWSSSHPGCWQTAWNQGLGSLLWLTAEFTL